jgi:hypothetical protein
LTALLTALVLLARLLFIPKVERASPLATRKRRSKQSASLEPNRVTIVMQVREVLEVYHADLPVGRFPFRRLVQRAWIRLCTLPSRAIQKNSSAE